MIVLKQVVVEEVEEVLIGMARLEQILIQIPMVIQVEQVLILQDNIMVLVAVVRVVQV